MKTPFLCIWRYRGHMTIWLGVAGLGWWGFYWNGGLRIRRYSVLRGIL